jgi:hypothetical protein
MDDPARLGRVVRDKNNQIIGIVEAMQASAKQLLIKEVNTGCYCFNFDWLRANIDKIKLDGKKEYYLTDLVKIAVKQEKKALSFKVDQLEWFGVNTKEQLDKANKLMTSRLQAKKRPVVFLVDLDNTILDTEAFKEKTGEKVVNLIKDIGAKAINVNKDIKKIFWESYEEIRERKGFIDIPEICRFFSQKIKQPQLEEAVKSIFFTAPFEKYLTPFSYEFLETLARFGEIVLVVEGDLVYQPVKIRNSGVMKLVDDYFIFENLTANLGEVIKIYDGWQTFIFDDQARDIVELRKINKNIVGFWLRKGPYKNQKPKDKKYLPQYQIKSLKQAIKTIEGIF